MISRKKLALIISTLVMIAWWSYSQLPPDFPICSDCNVILISLDTLRADHMGSYGYFRDTSPNIDSFARQSILFKNAFSHSSWTAPSHASLFTSFYPSDLNIIFHPAPNRLPESARTIAELFSENGYATAGFTGGGYVSTDYGFSQGFDLYTSNGLRQENNQESIYDWLEKHRQKKFFLFIHNYNVHRPYTPPEPYKKYYTNDTYTGSIEDLMDSIRVDYEQDGSISKRKQEYDYIVSQYDAEINYVDELIGDLLEKLSQEGFMDNTIIVLTSDHGEEFLEHGSFGHMRTLYDEVLSVPLILYAPDLPQGIVVERQVGLVDVFPTLLDLVGFERQESIRGESLVSPIYRDRGGKVILSETGTMATMHLPKGVNVRYLKSARTRDYKVIYDQKMMYPQRETNEDKTSLDAVLSYHLFDLSSDPRETRDVSSEEKLTTFRLRQYLIQKKLGVDTSSSTLRVSGKVRRQLKNLGYLT